MMNLVKYVKAKIKEIKESGNNFKVYTIVTLLFLGGFVLETIFVWSLGYLMVHLIGGLSYVTLVQAFPLLFFLKVLFYNCKSKYDKKVSK